MSDKVLASCTGTISVSNKGEKGAIERPRNWEKISDGSLIQSGTDGEKYIDIVLYGTEWYQCIKSFTKGDGVLPTNTIYFTKITDYQRLATNLFLAKTAYIENLGVDNIYITDEGKGEGNVLLKADKDGITCNSGTFKDVTVEGTLRSKYATIEDGNELSVVDNINLDADNVLSKFSLSWTSDMIGRTIRIVNCLETVAKISAPSGMYFSVDAENVSKIAIMPYACVILHGYGFEDTFKHWAVENNYLYTPTTATTPIRGISMKVISFGTLKVSYNTSNSKWVLTLVDKTPSGTITASRLGEGSYRLTCPASWSKHHIWFTKDLLVMVTGVGVKATVAQINYALSTDDQVSIDIKTSDGSSGADGSFSYIIYYTGADPYGPILLDY